MKNNYSLAAKVFMVSGKLPGLNEGMTFYQTPTGEKVNSRILAAYLITATIENLRECGALEYEIKEKKALIGGTIPILVLKRKKIIGVGFDKLILEKLEKETSLIDLVRDIIGGMYELPEYKILNLINSEFDKSVLMRQEEVKMMMFFSRKEMRWIPEKIKPFVDEWIEEIKPIWEKTLKLPWLKTAVRNCNFGFSTSKVMPDVHDDKD